MKGAKMGMGMESSKYSRHDIIGTWGCVDGSLYFMKMADLYALDDDDAFYILMDVVSISDLSTYAEFWREFVECNISPDVLVCLYDIVDQNPQKLMEGITELYDLYIKVYSF